MVFSSGVNILRKATFPPIDMITELLSMCPDVRNCLCFICICVPTIKTQRTGKIKQQSQVTTFPVFYQWSKIFSYMSYRHFHDALVAMVEPEYHRAAMTKQSAYIAAQGGLPWWFSVSFGDSKSVRSKQWNQACVLCNVHSRLLFTQVAALKHGVCRACQACRRYSKTSPGQRWTDHLHTTSPLESRNPAVICKAGWIDVGRAASDHGADCGWFFWG